MKRRNFIALTTLAAATVSVPFLNCSSADTELDKKLALPETLSQLLDQKNLIAIGKAYGAAKPNEYSASKLERELVQNGTQNISSTTSQKDIYSILHNHVQNDFETANTIILNGWVLSLTEARQCALYSLIAKK